MKKKSSETGKPATKKPMIQKKAEGGAVDGVRQHAALAMGKNVSGKKKGGKIC